jgi:hypothetical protein
MRKRTAFFVILLCLHWVMQGNAKAPANGIEPTIIIETPPCALPAPANLSWSFPTSNTVLITWTPVPGAWGYLVNLVDNTGSTGGVVQSNSILLPVTTNNQYTCYVIPKCSPNTVSVNFIAAKITTYIVIADVLLEYAPPCSSYERVADLDTGSNMAIDYELDGSKDYYLKFLKNGINYEVYFKKEMLQNPPPPPEPDYKFIMKPVEGQNSQLLCANSNNNGCIKFNFKITDNSAEVYFEMFKLGPSSSAATAQINIAENLINPFDAFGLRYCKDQFSGGGDTRDDGVTSSSHSYVVSPFHDYLQIGLDPSKRLKSVRMMDISGRLTFNQTMPDDMEFSEQLILPTEQLAQGLYILQLQSTDGKVEIFKVVKE